MENQQELTQFLDKVELFLAKALTQKAIKDVLERQFPLPEKINTQLHNNSEDKDV